MSSKKQFTPPDIYQIFQVRGQCSTLLADGSRCPRPAFDQTSRKRKLCVYHCISDPELQAETDDALRQNPREKRLYSALLRARKKQHPPKSSEKKSRSNSDESRH